MSGLPPVFIPANCHLSGNDKREHLKNFKEEAKKFVLKNTQYCMRSDCSCIGPKIGSREEPIIHILKLVYEF